MASKEDLENIRLIRVLIAHHLLREQKMLTKIGREGSCLTFLGSLAINNFPTPAGPRRLFRKTSRQSAAARHPATSAAPRRLPKTLRTGCKSEPDDTFTVLTACGWAFGRLGGYV